jgi:excisionase family DNA binding protein
VEQIASVLSSNKGQKSENAESTAALSKHPGRLRQSLENLHQALEEFESVLIECEEALEGKQTARLQERGGRDLLSVSQLSQELGMGKSWVYRQLKDGEIPTYRLGRNLKVSREELEEYLNSRRQSA